VNKFEKARIVLNEKDGQRREQIFHLNTEMKMADVDPARVLKEFKPKHKFFVGINLNDSAID